MLPRVPGRDFSGASRPEVWGTGFTLDGSHAELIAIPGPALSRKPSRAAKGEDVVIVGGWGGIGGAVAQLGRALGAAHVIGIDHRRTADGLARRLPHRCLCGRRWRRRGVSQDAHRQAWR